MQVIYINFSEEFKTFGFNCKFRKLITKERLGKNKNFLNVYDADYFCIKTECVRTCRFENCPYCKD